MNVVGIELNTEQVYTVMDMESWYHTSTKQCYEISGAAGTGKTTLVMYLIDRLDLKLDEVLFVAYMGKAATQLARNHLPAKTIHSAIYDYEYGPEYDENHHHILLPNGKWKMKGEFILKERLPKKIKLIVVDEGGMVPEKIAIDLMSFGLPIIVLGDLNQLPPVFGKPFFLRNPDSVLRKIMRQKEGDPIVWLSQQVLEGKRLQPGIYQNSAVIHRSDITDYLFKQSDIVLTERNLIRSSVNNYYREYLRRYRKLDRPNVGEKIICRKNNWDMCVGDGFYLTNGMTGVVEDVNMSSYNGKTIKINFLPDFINKPFCSIPISYRHLFGNDEYLSDSELLGERYLDKFEFAYAITVHSSQGSQYPNVTFLEDDPGVWSRDVKRKILYTAITRASEKLTFVLNK